MFLMTKIEKDTYVLIIREIIPGIGHTASWNRHLV